MAALEDKELDKSRVQWPSVLLLIKFTCAPPLDFNSATERKAAMTLFVLLEDRNDSPRDKIVVVLTGQHSSTSLES